MFFFNKYIDGIFYSFVGETSDAYEKKKELRNKILSLISYLSFVSLYFSTILTLLLSEIFRETISNNNFHLGYFIFFILIGGILNIRLISNKFKPSILEKIIINILVWSSVLLIFFFVV